MTRSRRLHRKSLVLVDECKMVCAAGLRDWCAPHAPQEGAAEGATGGAELLEQPLQAAVMASQVSCPAHAQLQAISQLLAVLRSGTHCVVAACCISACRNTLLQNQGLSHIA